VLGTDALVVRQNMNKFVVAPLAALFKMMSLGVSPEDFNSGPIEFDGNKTFLKPKNRMIPHEAPASEAPRSPPASLSASPPPPCDATLLASNAMVRHMPVLYPILAETTKQITNGHSWLGKFDRTNIHLWNTANSNLLEKPERTTLTTIIESKPARPVKVAIFDTGCDIDHAFFNGPGNEHRDNLLERWWDCLNESEEPVDDDCDRHGTALTALMLRLAPGAEVYVVRVAKNRAGLSAAKATIAKVWLHCGILKCVRFTNL
jgi:hypothetical protein